MLGFLSSPIEVIAAAPQGVETDLLVVPVFENDNPGAVAGLDAATGGEWSRALAACELTGKPFEVLIAPLRDGWAAPRVMFLGAGSATRFTHETASRLGAAAALVARQRRVTRIAILLRHCVDRPTGAAIDERLIQATAEGLVLGQFETAVHKSSAADARRLEQTDIVIRRDEHSGALQAAADRGRILGECANDARLLANEPANVLTPAVFAERAKALACGTKLRVEILDEHRIAELGMGLLLGVASGSAEPPRVIVLRHEPAGAPSDVTLGLVGKGITFDTGGISIKPAEGMDRMKSDMGGGAAVVGAMRALSRLHVPVHVIGIVPATENMPGGGAVKPGDILRSASGKTVEVLNTDAEGRLVLGDGLWYAQQLGATHLVDVATLTGACVVALGRWATGLFGRPDEWVDAVRQAADRAGERAWPLPVDDDYFDQLKSEWADMSNTGGRPAGAITAALFIKQFAGDLPWAHLDIAGTVWVDDAKPWQSKGATGTAVRTLVELALSQPQWPDGASAKQSA